MKKTIVPIGPYHPLQEEPEFFTLTIEGERVVDIDVRIGYNHRGIEKLSEMKTFDQSTFVIERICGICSASHILTGLIAVENAMDIQVSEQTNLLRELLDIGEIVQSNVYTPVS